MKLQDKRAVAEISIHIGPKLTQYYAKFYI